MKKLQIEEIKKVIEKGEYRIELLKQMSKYSELIRFACNSVIGIRSNILTEEQWELVNYLAANKEIKFENGVVIKDNSKLEYIDALFRKNKKEFEKD